MWRVSREATSHISNNYIADFNWKLWCYWLQVLWQHIDALIRMTSSNGNIFRDTGPLCGEFTGHRWIPHTKANDAELWCFLWSAPERTILSKQSWGWWLETPSSPLWHHSNKFLVSRPTDSPNRALGGRNESRSKSGDFLSSLIFLTASLTLCTSSRPLCDLNRNTPWAFSQDLTSNEKCDHEWQVKFIKNNEKLSKSRLFRPYILWNDSVYLPDKHCHFTRYMGEKAYFLITNDWILKYAWELT